MRSNTVKLPSGYMYWTRRLRVWFHSATPALALLVTLACGADSELKSTPTNPQLPVTVVTGADSGPTLALVAGVHGGKQAAVRAAEQLARELPGQLRRGRVLILAPANAAGYRAGLAQLSPDDSLNLNRVFPGRADGRPTERLAAAIMSQLVAESDYLVDMHGSDGDEAVGRFAYAAHPGLDDAVDQRALQLARAWRIPTIVWDTEGPRSIAESRFLQTAAHLSGVAAITVFEAGSARDDSLATAAFVRGARRVLQSLEMLPPSPDPAADVAVSHTAADSARVLARRVVTTAASAGLWAPSVSPGSSLRAGELLGRLTSSVGDTSIEVRAGESGLVLHQRKAGAVSAGAPLIIAATAAARSDSLTRP